MMPKQVVFALVTFLHDLFTAAWVGGMLTLVISVLPAARDALGKGPVMKRLVDAIQKRLSVVVYVSIVGLAVTGMLLSNRSAAFQGLFSVGNTFSAVLAAKHVLVIAMVAIALVRSLALGRRPGPLTASQENLNLLLLLANAVLGVAVLLLSGFSAAYASPPPAP